MKAPSLAPFYAVLAPVLAEVARAHGYALAVHGTLQRDMDFVAVPWTEEASEPLPMVLAMKEACSAVFTHPDWDDLIPDGNPTDKPHGRKAWSLHLTNKGAKGPYIDISVMPRKS